MKKVFLASSLAILVTLAGCGTMMILLGDNVRYSISGKVTDCRNGNAMSIKNVSVKVDCPGIERSMYQNRKGVTDENGNFRLIGYWELQGCKVHFKKQEYNALTINIDESHMEEIEYALSRSYIVNVCLENTDTTVQ